jgi:hypothetical protein
MKKIVLLLVLVGNYAFSQSVNDYQYVMIPSKFSIFKEENKFNLNSLTKFMLKKYGFVALLPTDEISDEVANNNCKKLYADLANDNGLLNVKVKVILKDCKGNVVYETKFGKSNEKDLNTAYNIALREAGKSFETLNYKYNGKSEATTQVVESKTEVTIPKRSIEPTEISQLHSEPLFAKPFGENGFQLLTNDTDVPRYVMTIYKTSSPDCYLVNNSVLIRKSGKWFLEYYKEDKLVSELITIVNLN